MVNFSLPRLDKNLLLREHLLKYCRLKRGEIWEDPKGKHKIGCLDIGNEKNVAQIMGNEVADLSIQDPPIILLLSRN